jgi:hypothetical protein
VAVAPKSEYLRNALQARRAQNTPTPSPLPVRPPPTPSPKPLEVKTPRTSPDLFAEFALSEEQTAPVSPIRRRRPSEGGPPRSKTARELTNEVEKLKDNLMTSNMRVELLKKNNSELQHSVARLKEQVEELEPLEEENNDLQNENNRLKLKMQDMDVAMACLRDDNNGLRKCNEDMLAINEECASHWEDQESAVQEAADTIVALETEKAALAAEVQHLKKRMTALEVESSAASILVGGSPRYPMRVHSIDESRPDTSHFDSDYFSQPDSPRLRTSRESIISINPSERSKKFLEKSDMRKRSVRDLAKRMSAASLKALRVRSPSPTPKVPPIPPVYQQPMPQAVEQVVRTPKRRFPQQPLLDALEISPIRPESGTSYASTSQSDGLRGMYHPSGSTSSSHDTPPTNIARPSRRNPSGAEVLPRVPSRDSSRQAHTSSSGDHLSQRSSYHARQRRRSNSDSPPHTAQPAPEEWAPMPPPPVLARVSLISEVDLTSEVDPQENTERWWRSVDRLTQPQSQQQPAPTPQQHRTQQPPHATDTTPQQRAPNPAHFPPSHVDIINVAGSSSSKPSARFPRAEDELRRNRTQPSTPAASAGLPFERDFFFNGSEDEEMFMRKARASMGTARR